MKNTQKGFILPLIIILIAAIAFGGTYLYIHKQAESPFDFTGATETSSTTIPIYLRTSATTSTVIGIFDTNKANELYQKNTPLKNTIINLNLRNALGELRIFAEQNFYSKHGSYENICSQAEARVVSTFNSSSIDPDGFEQYSKIQSVPGFTCVSNKIDFAASASIIEKDGTQNIYCTDSRGSIQKGAIDTKNYICVSSYNNGKDKIN